MRVFLLLILSLLSGCTTIGQGVAVDLPAVPADRGIVIFSTGFENMQIWSPVGITLVDEKTKKRFDRVSMFFNYPSQPDFPDSNGHVRSLTLPPGKYYLMPYAGNPYAVTVSTSLFAFEVVANKAVYLGTLFYDDKRITLLKSNQKRDLDYFASKNPKIARTKIETEFMRMDQIAISPNDFIQGVIWELP